MYQAMLHIRKMNQLNKYQEAGGYTSYAEEKYFIVYPNGTSIPLSSFPRLK